VEEAHPRFQPARQLSGTQIDGPFDDQTVVAAFRRYTLLPLDDRLYAIHPIVAHLTRSSLHRCFQRHGISRLPDTEGDEPQCSKFKRHPIRYFHIDIAEVRTEEGKFHLFVAIDRTSKFAFAEPDIEHRLTKPRRPWTDGQIERMNRTIKDAAVRRFHYESHDQRRQHLANFFAAYSLACRLKTLRGLTLHEAICKARTDEPLRFLHDPRRQIPGRSI
jgi:hypothetical protein